MTFFMIAIVISLPICFADELSLVYDANRNLVSGDGRYRVYNSLNQLWKVYNESDAEGTLLQEHTYHPLEERVLVKKTYDENGWVESVYYIDENYVHVVNATGSYNFTYVYHEGQLVAQVNPDGSKLFIHGDHLGSSTVVTNESEEGAGWDDKLWSRIPRRPGSAALTGTGIRERDTQ